MILRQMLLLPQNLTKNFKNTFTRQPYSRATSHIDNFLIFSSIKSYDCQNQRYPINQTQNSKFQISRRGNIPTQRACHTTLQLLIQQQKFVAKCLPYKKLGREDSGAAAFNYYMCSDIPYLYIKQLQPWGSCNRENTAT